MEHITTSAVSRVAPSFLIFKAPRAKVIFLSPLRVLPAISAVLIYAFRGSASSEKKRKLLADVFSLQRVIKQAFHASGDRLRRGFADPFPAGAAPSSAPSSPAAFPGGGTCVPDSADGYQALLERIDLLEHKLADASIPVPHETDWIPLVKAPGASSAGSGVTQKDGVARSGRLEPTTTCDGTKAVLKGSFDLGARKVLCVGGKAALYPEYRCLVEASGATVFFYRSGPRPATGGALWKLLAQADMVMCAVDCVNHEAYFTAKRYCKYFGKPCVLLDRSDLATFRKGVVTLAELAAQAGDPPQILPGDPP